MKLAERERVEGTRVTIGRRVLSASGDSKLSRKYVAEYRDGSGRQVCESLRVTNRVLARRLALEVQQRLERGEAPPVRATLSIDELVEQYKAHVRLRQAAPKTLAKYEADLAKLASFATDSKIVRASAFDEDAFLRFREWLQKKGFAAKTIYGVLTLTKQALKWAWRKRLIPSYPLADVPLPKAKARPQPCFTSEQVDQLIAALDRPNGRESDALAFALLGYAGLRIGEVEQLRWEDVVFRDGKPEMLHIRRGGSNGTTKDKDERFVPVHPKIAEKLLRARATRGASKPDAARGELVCPTARERKLLMRLKRLCKALGFPKPQQWKLHSFRHHFASLCANHGVAYRKALAWLGHSSSDMLDLYYHLHDADSRHAMLALAAEPGIATPTATAGEAGAPVGEGGRSPVRQVNGPARSASSPDDFAADATCGAPVTAAPAQERAPGAGERSADAEGTLKTSGQSAIEKLAELPEFQALAEALGSNTERGGFEPPVPCGTPVFETGSISRSDTSPCEFVLMFLSPQAGRRLM